MCLDSHAHGMRIKHEIFNHPHAVNLTISELPTPKEYRRYGVGATMPMWRVQTEGYREGNGQLIGVVSRDMGFLDSPDTEWISSGVNSKNPDAVALGRHGSFFHWGFAVSPTYMTDEAKLVFINAIHYIAKFDHQPLLARKKQGMVMRKSIENTLARTSDEGYAEALASHEEFKAKIKTQKSEIRKRLQAGEEVSKRDRQMLEMKEPRKPDRFGEIKRYVEKSSWTSIANDRQKIKQYFEANLPFIRPQGWYGVTVDQELKTQGWGSNDPQFLSKTIDKLGSGNFQEKQVAQSLLGRYTDVSFDSHSQWKAWFQENQDAFFFSEAAGYKWLVNTLQPKPAKKNEASSESSMLRATPSNPFVSEISATSLGKGRFVVRVDFDIAEGWHAYDSVPAGAPYIPLTVELILPSSMKLEDSWQRPTSEISRDDASMSVFTGPISFTCVIQSSSGKDHESVTCKIGYQVCDQRMCLPPTKESLVLKIPLKSTESKATESESASRTN
ncbi:MAG: hypothetical protein ACI97A_002827 [Planctomycetota bacterium]|jgi:hypothetical protein